MANPLITYTRPNPTQPGWCDSGEAVKPSNTDIAIGWPGSQIPPSRQEFNWLDKQQDAGIKYLCRVGIAQWDENESYQGFGLAIGSNGSVYWNLQPCIGVDPVFDNTGMWELTTVRLSDADARYVVGGSGMYLTQSLADGRYQLLANMGQYLTVAAADGRYPPLSTMANYLTRVEAFGTFARLSDVGLSEGAVQATYLRIVDAANTYLSKSEAAQTYLSIADANNRFNQAYADLQWYAQQVANNADASARAWVNSMFGRLSFDRIDKSNGSTMQVTWLIIGASPNAGSPWTICLGSGFCQEGDTIIPPDGFPQSQMTYRGWVASVPPSLPSLPAVGGFVFNFGANGVVVDCYYIKQNDGNTRRGRGYCYGSFVGFGYR